MALGLTWWLQAPSILVFWRKQRHVGLVTPLAAICSSFCANSGRAIWREAHRRKRRTLLDIWCVADSVWVILQTCLFKLLGSSVSTELGCMTILVLWLVGGLVETFDLNEKMPDSVSDGWRLLHFGFQVRVNVDVMHGWISGALGLDRNGFNDADLFW